MFRCLSLAAARRATSSFSPVTSALLSRCCGLHSSPQTSHLPPLPVAANEWRYEEAGAIGTHSWRGQYYHVDGEADAPGTQRRALSPWHRFPSTTLAEGGDMRLLCVVEIPRGEAAKREMCATAPFNPLQQDVFKKQPGKPLRFLRYTHPCLAAAHQYQGAAASAPVAGVPFAYGFVPGTIEDPTLVQSAPSQQHGAEESTALRGDGDPLDVVLIDPQQRLQAANQPPSTTAAAAGCGGVWECNVLGALPMVDEGEMDWKVIAEPVKPWNGRELAPSPLLTSLDEVPGEVLAALYHWFRFYKTVDGKPETSFLSVPSTSLHSPTSHFFGAEEAWNVVRSCATQYLHLILTEEGQRTAQKLGFWMGEE